MTKIHIKNLNPETQIQQLEQNEQLKISGGTVAAFKLGEPVLLPNGVTLIPVIFLGFPPSPPPQPFPPTF
ncbi:MAG: hypothetical protein MUD14_00260 [Hydrococcus sp. Prado102]|jgi:hypothetical protein|nr:hypothetical protein [Hydrococcus sp. Prado102]